MGIMGAARKVMHNLHMLHAAHQTHETLKKDEERRKEIVRKAKEKNWPGFFGTGAKKGEKAKAEPEKAQRKNGELPPHHKLLLAHFAKKFGAKKEEEAEK